MAAAALFSFSSCEDVPNPYNLPEKPGEQPAEEGTYLDESFASSFGKFEVVTPKGTAWVIDYSTAKATGYDNSSKTTTPSESYLISPEVDLSNSKGAYLQFQYIYMYKRTGASNTLLITDNYTGDPTTTQWEVMKDDWTIGSDWNTFADFKKNIDSKYLGKKIRIALYYSCESQSSTIEVKNLVMKEGKIDETEEPTTPSDDVITPTNGSYINETFASSFGVFSEKTIKGTPWAIDYSTAKATGYDNASKATTPSASYLISKPMDMSSSSKVNLQFSYILRYSTKNGAAVEGVSNKVLITDNYTGDPTTTSWTDITGSLTEGSDWKTWSEYSHDLSAFAGKKKVVIALYYACEASSSTWEVKNLTVKDGNGSSEKPDTPDTPATSDGISINDLTVTLTNAGATAGESIKVDDISKLNPASSLESLTLSDGTVLSFDKGSGTTPPAYNANYNELRLYANNKMTITGAKKIAKIIFTCTYDNNKKWNAVGNETATVAFSGNTATYTNTFSGTGGGVQFRFKAIEIIYAK